MRRMRRGFSLIELVVVLSLVSLIAMVLVPRWAAGNRSELQATASDILAALADSKRAAMLSGEPQQFKIDVNRRVWQAGNRHGRIPDRVSVRFVFGQATLAAPVAPEIRFSPQGHASGGVLLLESEGQQRRIAVDWLTGEASIQKVRR